MKTITSLKATARQRFQIPLENGLYVDVLLRFLPAISQWAADVTYEGFELTGMRVCNSVNVLSQYSAIIPFGILIDVYDGGEPFLINDFASGRVKLSILSAEEVTQINTAEGAS